MTKVKEKSEKNLNTLGLIHIEEELAKEGCFWKKAKILCPFLHFN